MVRTIQILLQLCVNFGKLLFSKLFVYFSFYLDQSVKYLSILLTFPKNQKKFLWSRREPNRQRRAQALLGSVAMELHAKQTNGTQLRSANCQPVCRYRSENRWWLFPVTEFWRWFVKQLWLADTVYRYRTLFNQFPTDGTSSLQMGIQQSELLQTKLGSSLESTSVRLICRGTVESQVLHTWTLI